MNFFIETLFSNPLHFFGTIVLVTFSVCLHEYMHALVALKLGDPTAAQTGHLTLNPLKQMGWYSIFMLLMFGLCWGAVPVNPYLVDRKRRIAIALAGPATNLALFFAFLAVVLFTRLVPVPFLFLAGVMGAQLNALLFFINILPVPGFDGGIFLLEFVPWQKFRSSEFAKGAMMFMVLLLFMGFGRISAAAAWLVKFFLALIFPEAAQ